MEYLNTEFIDISNKNRNLEIISVNFNENSNILNKYFDKIYIRSLHQKDNKPDYRYIPLIYKLLKYKLNCLIFKTNPINEKSDLFKMYEYYKNKKELTHFEKTEGCNISKVGEIGCIDSIIQIIKHAKKNNYKKILLLDDDFILHKDINQLFTKKINSLPSKNWKILFLGCSQWTWFNSDHKMYDLFGLKEKDWYYPFRPCGTFGLALSSSIYDELLDYLYQYTSPADTYPLWQIFNKLEENSKKYYYDKTIKNYEGVYVIYPNLIIADVTDSNLREGMDQINRAKSMKWDLKYYPYVYQNELYKIREILNCNIFNKLCNYTKVNIEEIIEKIPELKEYDYILKKIINFYGDENKSTISVKTFGDIIHCFPEKKFVIIIPSFNNKLWYQNNIDSIFEQQYNNFRIIYIDDKSEDNTYELVNDYLKKKNYNSSKIQIFQQKIRQRQGAAKYIAGHMCDDNEIICILDGDDWFAHSNVLNILNYEYSKNNIWCTYGRFQRVSNNEDDLSVIKNGKKVLYINSSNRNHTSETIQNNTFRKSPWLSTHLKTFYASIFKQIPINYFLDHENNFAKVCTDCAEMFSILELSGFRQKCINNILYSYNVENTNNHPTSYYKKDENDYWNIYREKISEHLLNLIPLQPLNKLPKNKKENIKIEIIITVGPQLPLLIDELWDKIVDETYIIQLIKGNNKWDNEYVNYFEYIKLKLNILIKEKEDKKPNNNVNFKIYLNKYIPMKYNFEKYCKIMISTQINKFYLQISKNDAVNYNYLNFLNDTENIVLLNDISNINKRNRIECKSFKILSDELFLGLFK